MQLEKLGPYRIGRRLGRGGMGTVYAAEAIDTRMPAAVKVLSAGLAHEAGFRDRFEAEIETLRKLRHPNIVRLYGFGQENDILFYAMELVEGTSLEEQLQSGRRFNWKEVLPIAIKVARALRHAHDSGVIHRDIKPANLLLSDEGQIKLSDFGIAKLFGASSMTADGGVVGTAEYMAPEQADGRPVTQRSDLYSLGCVLYALCAGRPPFRARSLPEMLHMQRFADPEPLRTFAPEVPAELEQIISELLEKEAERRIPTALVLARRMEAMEHGLLRRERRTLSNDEAGADEFIYNPEASAARPLDDAAAASTQATGAPDLAYEIKSDAAPTRLIGSPQDSPTLDAATPTPNVANTEQGTIQVIGPSSVPSASPKSADATSTPPSTDAPAAPSRFTRVEEVEEQERQARRAPIINAQTLVLVAALAMLAAGGWYFLRPVSADTLYRQVTKVSAKEQPDELTDVEPQIKTFLAQYPRDPRAAELRELQSEIDLYRSQRRFQRRLHSPNKEEVLSSVERAYLEGVRAAETDSDQGIKKLQALLALYSGDEQLSKSSRQCLLLAQRQLDQLKAQVAESQTADLAELERQLARARDLAPTQPGKAAAIWGGIIEFYGDKPWAKKAVQAAQQSLTNIDNTAQQ